MIAQFVTTQTLFGTRRQAPPSCFFVRRTTFPSYDVNPIF